MHLIVKVKLYGGNDNKLYKSVADKRGVYTWKLVTVNNNKTRKQPKGKHIGKTHTYLLQEEVVIENKKLDLSEDAYKQYYMDKIPGKKFRIKTIAK